MAGQDNSGWPFHFTYVNSTQLMKGYISTFLIISCFFGGYAQSIKLKMYSNQDGLSNNIIRNITQDKFGHIWIGTENGLNKFDGHQFTSFLNKPSDERSISNNLIFGLDSDQEGVIWVGTDFGLNAYDPSSNTFTSFTQSDNPTSISNNHIRTIFVDVKNNVWIGTEDGLNLFNRKDSTFKRFEDNRILSNSLDKKDLSFNRINDISQTSDGKVWVATDGGGIKIYSDTTDNFLPIHLPSSKQNRLFKIVRTIFQDSDGIIWFGCDGGLVSYDTKGIFKEFFPSPKPDSLGYQYIWSIVEPNPNELWLGSYGGGLIVFDKQGETFTSHLYTANRSSAYEDNLIWPLFKDQSANIWLGFDGNGGLGYYNHNLSKFQHLLGAGIKGEKNNVWDIIEISEDSLLIGTTKETFLWIEGNSKKSLNHLTGDYKLEPKTIQLQDGYLFSGHDQLVLVDNNFTIKQKIQDDKIGTVTCGVQDSKGIIWLGTISNGLVRFNPKTKEVKHYFEEGHLNIYHDSRSISSLHLQSDTLLWIGRVRFGLTSLNTSTEKSTHYLYGSKQFPEPTINSIALNGEELLLGTNDTGLIHFNLITKEATVSPYLDSNSIQSILIDDQIRYWIATINGLIMLDVKNDSVVKFGMDDGLQSMIFNKSAFAGKNGYLYFGGENGINKFNPNLIQLDTITSPILIDDIKINNKSLDWSLSNPIFEANKISLHHSQNDVSFSFISNNYLHSNSYQFEYSINKESWKSLGNQRILNLSNLSPGVYSIGIRSVNHDNFASAPKTIQLTISHPWYNTIWFKIISACVLFISGILIYAYRLRSIKRQNKYLEEQVIERTRELELSKHQVEEDKKTIEKSLEERESLLKEIHHRVKNNLQIIASLLYLQSGKFENEDFKKVLEEGQGRVRSMALIHQKLYENEDLKSIPFGEYLQELVSEIRASFGMNNIELNIEAKNIYFDVDTAVPLGLIVNEMATNAFKYAFDKEQKGNISIFLTEKDGEYLLNVKDDGKGIPDEIDIRKTKSLGLRLVRMLSQQLEGDFEFQSDNGTSFELRFAA